MDGLGVNTGRRRGLRGGWGGCGGCRGNRLMADGRLAWVAVEIVAMRFASHGGSMLSEHLVASFRSQLAHHLGNT